MKVFNPRFNAWILRMRDQEWCGSLNFLSMRLLWNLFNLLSLKGYWEVFIGKYPKEVQYHKVSKWDLREILNNIFQISTEKSWVFEHT